MVGDTLKTINAAADGLAKLSKNAEHIDDFLNTWTKTGQDVSAASKGIDQFIKTNENDLRTTIVNLQKVGEKLNNTLTPETQDSLKTGIAKLSSATARLDAQLADLGPLLKDLGSPVNHTPDHRLRPERPALQPGGRRPRALFRTLRTRKGTLNTDGSLQKLLTQADLTTTSTPWP